MISMIRNKIRRLKLRLACGWVEAEGFTVVQIVQRGRSTYISDTNGTLYKLNK